MPSIAFERFNQLLAFTSLAQSAGARNAKGTASLIAAIGRFVPLIRAAAKKEFDPNEFVGFERQLSTLEQTSVQVQIGNATIAEVAVRLNELKKQFDLSTKEIIYLDSPRLRQAYALFVHTFTHKELDDLRVFGESCKEALDFTRGGKGHKQVTRLFIAVQNGVTVGAAWGTYIPSSNIGFHWYLAISPEARSGGIGTLLRERMNRSFDEDARRCGFERSAGCFGEIEYNSPWLKKARQVWNVMPLDIVYESPRVGAVVASVGKYCLYFQPTNRMQDCIDSETLYKMVYDIFRWGYWMAKPENDPNVRQTLLSIKRQKFICARPA